MLRPIEAKGAERQHPVDQASTDGNSAGIAGKFRDMMSSLMSFRDVDSSQSLYSELPEMPTAVTAQPQKPAASKTASKTPEKSEEDKKEEPSREKQEVAARKEDVPVSQEAVTPEAVTSEKNESEQVEKGDSKESEARAVAESVAPHKAEPVIKTDADPAVEEEAIAPELKVQEQAKQQIVLDKPEKEQEQKFTPEAENSTWINRGVPGAEKEVSEEKPEIRPENTGFESKIKKITDEQSEQLVSGNMAKTGDESLQSDTKSSKNSKLNNLPWMKNEDSGAQDIFSARISNTLDQLSSLSVQPGASKGGEGNSQMLKLASLLGELGAKGTATLKPGSATADVKIQPQILEAGKVLKKDSSDTGDTKEVKTPGKFMPRLMEKVEEAVKEVEKSKDGKSITVRLDPPKLGTVRVQFNLVEGGMHARFSADNPVVAQMLRDRADDLQVLLRKIVSEFDQATVSFGGNGGSFEQPHSEARFSFSENFGREKRNGSNRNHSKGPVVAGVRSRGGGLRNTTENDHWVA